MFKVTWESDDGGDTLIENEAPLDSLAEVQSLILTLIDASVDVSIIEVTEVKDSSFVDWLINTDLREIRCSKVETLLFSNVGTVSGSTPIAGVGINDEKVIIDFDGVPQNFIFDYSKVFSKSVPLKLCTVGPKELLLKIDDGNNILG